MQYKFLFSVNWSVFVWDCVKEISGKEYVIQFVVGWVRLDNICCIQWTHMFHDSLSFITGDFCCCCCNFGYIALWCFFFCFIYEFEQKFNYKLKCLLIEIIVLYYGEKTMISWLSVHKKKNWQVVVFTQYLIFEINEI